MSKLKIGVSLESFNLPLRRALVEAEKLGVRGIKVNAVGDLAPGSLSQTGRREFRHLLRNHQLELTAVGCPLRRGLDTIENLHLQFARHLRARLEVVAPALLPSADPRNRRDVMEWQTVLDEHRAILDAFEKGDLSSAKTTLKRHISHHGSELVKRLRAAPQSTGKPK